MEDNSKLFVFEKKEVALIFIFIILIAVISFTLGVRTGKKLSLKHDNYSTEDMRSIDLKSTDEESVEATVDNGNSGFESSLPDSKPVPDVNLDMETRLKEEMKKLAETDITEGNNLKEKTQVAPQNPNESGTDLYNTNEDYKGKYTIQLFADQDKTIAQDFADGFILKGYDVIVNEAVITGKGKWYRVSIGVFDTVNEAKNYLEKEKNLFQGKRYLINQF